MNDAKSLIAVFDNLNGKVKELKEQFSSFKTIEGKRGSDGKDGVKGAVGTTGASGKDGKVGLDGSKGKDGLDGTQGVGIEDAEIDFDGHLVLTLTNGEIIDAGEVELGENGQPSVVNYSSGVSSPKNNHGLPWHILVGQEELLDDREQAAIHDVFDL